MAGGKGGTPRTHTSQSSSGTSNQTLDPQSRQYVENFLRPLGQAGANAALDPNANFFPGANQYGQQAVDGMAQPINFGLGGANPQMIQGPEQGFGTNVQGAGMGFSPEQMQLQRIQQFQDPHEQAVVQGLQGDYQHQRQMANQAAQQQATAAGAFGGSRGEILQAQSMEDVNRAEAAHLAQVRSQGYGQALGAAQGEHAQMQQLGSAGAQAQLQADTQRNLAQAQMDMQAQNMGMQMQHLNQQAGLQGYGMDQQAAMAQAGMQQQQNQHLLQGGEYLRNLDQMQAQSPLFQHQQALNFGMGALGPYGTSTSYRDNQSGWHQEPQGGGGWLGGAIGGGLAGYGTAGPWGALAGGVAGALGHGR